MTTTQRTAALASLSLLFYVILFCNPVQFWVADIAIGLSR